MSSLKSFQIKQFVFLSLVLFFVPITFAQQKALTVTDMMKFKHIQNPAISEEGNWVVYSVKPDRGDGEAVVLSTTSTKEFKIERGSRPILSKNGRWVAATVLPKAVDLGKKGENKPKNGMTLLNTSTGNISDFENVQKFVITNNSRWLVYQLFKEEMKAKEKEDKDYFDFTNTQDEKDKKPKKKKNVGTDLILRYLDSAEETKFPFVKSFSFDSTSSFLVFSVADTMGEGNSLFFIDLGKDQIQKQIISQEKNGHYDNLSWQNKKGKLAFFAGILNEKEKPESVVLKIWDSNKKKVTEALTNTDLQKDWVIHIKNNVSWSKDGKRLFLGTKPKSEIIEDDAKKEDEKEVDLFDIEEIRNTREVDVWHWDDPLINSNQKKMWSRVKDRTYLGVYHVDSDKFVQLANPEMPDVRNSGNPKLALGSSNVPYQKMITWYGRLSDYYLVDLQKGTRKKIKEKLESGATLSPKAHYIIYYEHKNWYLYNVKSNSTKNITKTLDVPFYNEDHDYPSPVPGYGVAGWTEKDKHVLLYDKYDIWQIPTGNGKAVKLTDGRKDNIIYRIQRVDREKRFYKNNEELFLTAYHDLKKTTALYSGQVGNPGVKKLIEADKKFSFVAKAKKVDKILFTRQSYTEYPDLWISDLNLTNPKKITDINPQVKDFAWGKAELVEWNSIDGKPLQGILIKPGNYEEGKKYPVLVYYYRFFSQRLHEFNQVVVNHRPCFPFYTSNGYAVFLPDIRFEVGRPGFAATKCLVPGIQKIIDLGIADPNAVALHGHSWSGYQTAFVITQTDIFKCAIAGAPVSNMTSAYGGIRWGTGLARQFQYEQSQSRIGGTLWNSLNKYIENSPLFYVDRINTPLLLMHGDIDDAVPWYQSIELYLGMRRFGKDCIFLQYRNEPHHPQKYSNKLDYTLKMKEYLDHYLKGMPAADWIKDGVLYQGK